MTEATSSTSAQVPLPVQPNSNVPPPPSIEEAAKKAAASQAEKLTEKISKVKGKVVVPTSKDQTKPSLPGLLNKGDGESSQPLSVQDNSDNNKMNTSQSRSSSDYNERSNNNSPSLSITISNNVHGASENSPVLPTTPSSSSPGVSGSPRLSPPSIRPHFLLDDVVHAGTRNRSGSGSRERTSMIFEKGSEPTLSLKRRSLDDPFGKANPVSHPPPSTIEVSDAQLKGIASSGTGTTTGSTVESQTLPNVVPTNIISPGPDSVITTLPTKIDGSGSLPPNGVPLNATSSSAVNGDPRLPQDDGKLHILLAATGSVSTGKLRLIIHKLTEIYGRDRACIQIILTKAAENFVSRGEIPSHIRIWRDKDEWATWQGRADPVVHIELRRWADILVIAPLSANTLGKIALGLCDNLLTCVVRAWNTQYPILIAPSMVLYAYNHPATRSHLKVIKEEMKWIEVLKPVEKVVGSYGDIGMGGMMDWNEIVNKIVMKLGGYPEEEEEEEDTNEGNGDDDDDDDDDEDEDEDDETDLSGRSTRPSKSAKKKASQNASEEDSLFENDDDDLDLVVKRLSLADRDHLDEEKGKLRSARHTFD